MSFNGKNRLVVAEADFSGSGHGITSRRHIRSHLDLGRFLTFQEIASFFATKEQFIEDEKQREIDRMEIPFSAANSEHLLVTA